MRGNRARVLDTTADDRVEAEGQRVERSLSPMSPRRVYDRGFRFRWTPPSKQERTAVGAIAPPVTFLSINVTL